ncbi:MAG TPA: SRPBCC domain-containing protein [Spirochaetia bacterium]|nr:SRPBCC domain-containing protein [Spirochaetia bacterium]HUZ17641.1 SRPBCC domain-containing protein [Spirochaetia bacterium]
MSTDTQTGDTVQVYRIYIKTDPQKVWDAITKPEWTAKYGYGGRGEYDLRPGGKYVGYTSQEMKEGAASQGIQVPDIAIEGEIIEVDIPRKLILTWHMVMDPNTAADSHTRLTYELQEIAKGVTRLTLTHELAGAPAAADILSGKWESEGAGGGWSWVLSDMKSVIETGNRMAQ